MELKKKPYAGQYPSRARFLMEEDITSIPRQVLRPEIRWAESLDIIYTLRNLTPANFEHYKDDLLLLAYQECMRYNKYKWKFASFDVRLGRLSKGKDLPEIATFQASMHDDPDILVFGPGYETPRREFLYLKVDDIIDLAKKYKDKVSKQRPYKVIRLTISIREPRE